MSGDVVLSSAMRTNLLTLQRTQSDIDTVQNRLATGLKVNSALDNPQSFFAAQSLNNRAGDLSRLLDGIGQSIRTIEEADNGISALTDLVQQADSIATEAQSEIRAAEGFSQVRGSVDLSGVTDLTAINGGGTFADGDTFTVRFYENDGTTTTDQTANVVINTNDTVDNIVAEINSNSAINSNVRASVTSAGQLKIESLNEGGLVRIEDSVGGTSLGADGFAALGLDGAVGSENRLAANPLLQAGTAVAGRTIQSNVSAAGTVNGEYEASALLVGGAGNAGFATIGAGDDLVLNIRTDGGAPTTAITFDEDSTIQDLIDGVNNDANLSAAGVSASFDTSTGRIQITAGEDVGQLEVEFGSAAGATSSFGFGTAASDAAIAAGDSQSELFTFVGTSANLEQFESDFNNVRQQIDDLVEDASYRGVNLLAGDDLTTFFNEDSSSSLTTEGADFSSLGLGIAEADFTTSANIQLSLDSVESALSDVRNFGSSIANDLAIMQTRQDFTSETINTLEAGADDLTVADLNEEGANLLALQTRQQLGTTALSLASQSQQSVLRLF